MKSIFQGGSFQGRQAQPFAPINSPVQPSFGGLGPQLGQVPLAGITPSLGAPAIPVQPQAPQASSHAGVRTVRRGDPSAPPCPICH